MDRANRGDLLLESSDPVTALKQMGAQLTLDDQGEVVGVGLSFNSKIDDSRLALLKGLTNLKTLWLVDTRISDAGLLHLEGLVKLEQLNLASTRIRDAGLVHLKRLTKL